MWIRPEGEARHSTYRKNKNPFQRDRLDAHLRGGVVSVTVGMAVRPTGGKLRAFEENWD